MRSNIDRPRWRQPMLILLRWTLLYALLSLTVVLGDKKAADYYVDSLPGAPEGPLLKMHAGHIEVDPEHNGHLFFWHFQNRHIANKQRTVIWLNGGPGCSSMDGALMEVGPYRLKDDASLRYSDGSWDEFANLLFVDQPVGTGFSYVNTDSYLHELNEMADSFIVFLEKFFGLFPEYETDDIYLAGESYAGQHIPYIAQAITERNGGDVKHRWNLSGLLIGNGWISPHDQYLSYLPMAREAGIVPGGSATAQQLEAQQALCNSQLSKPGGDGRVEIAECENVLTEMLRLTQRDGPDDKRCVNMYDYRLGDSYPGCGLNWPPDLTKVTPYLRRSDVIKALHVNGDKETGWTECVGAVGSSFRAVKSRPSVTLLPSLLEKIPVVLFSGEKDLICNHLGTEAMIHDMKWNGGTGFELSPGTWAPRRDWTFEGKPAGIYQEARNLTYILFYNASHMVPFDWPRRSRDMFDRFARVDIASIGGTPADSRIDGEKGLEVSVGGHPNSTVAEEKEARKLKEAKWEAYYRSGEVALVLVILATVIGGWFLWRQRRRQGGPHAPYYGLLSPANHYDNSGNDHDNPSNAGASTNGQSSRHRRRLGVRSGIGLERFRRGGQPGGGRLRGISNHADDIEAADFDENELDHLHVPSPGRDDDDDDDDDDGGGGVGEQDDEEEKDGKVNQVKKGRRRRRRSSRKEGEQFKLAVISDEDDDDDDNDDHDDDGYHRNQPPQPPPPIKH